MHLNRQGHACHRPSKAGEGRRQWNPRGGPPAAWQPRSTAAATEPQTRCAFDIIPTADLLRRVTDAAVAAGARGTVAAQAARAARAEQAALLDSVYQQLDAVSTPAAAGPTHLHHPGPASPSARVT